MLGKTLAHYEILDKLGEGGMGAVYLAKDTKLGREVALKILPDHFAKDPERLARFNREARTLAALNHPNVAAIYGLEADQGVNFLVMERAEGEDLSERIARGPLPHEEAVAIAKQIAQGLEEAHASGIIHRDLKPANVKLSPDGKIKVLDFGLARAFQGESTAEEETLHSPTITAAMTGAGVILGTAAYMSPEQARGTTVDRRSDIWSFGVVLFEMLTGKRLFQGQTVSDTLAGILKSDPDWDLLPEETPDTLRLLLARCLVRDRLQRLQDIGEARILLSGDGVSSLYTNLSMSRIEDGELVATPTNRRKPLMFAALGLVLGLIAGGAVFKALTPEPPNPPTRRLDVALPPGAKTPARNSVISPDGRMAVYEMNDRLWLRRIDTGASLELPGTEGGVFPFWSPDNTQVGYFEGSRVMRLMVDGGAPVTVTDIPDGKRADAGAWSEDDIIIYTLGDPTGLLAVPSRGGVPTSYLVPDTSRVQDFHDPTFIEGGRGVLYSSHLKQADFTRLHHFRDGQEALVFDGIDDNIRNPVFCPSGHVLFRKDGPNSGVWAIPYDPDAMQVEGEAFLVVGDGLWPSVSRDQTLLCGSGNSVSTWQVVECDRGGRVVARHGEPQALRPFMALDPAAERVVLSVDNGDNHQLWILDLTRGTQSRLTFDDLSYTVPTWTGDGMFVLAAGGNSGATGFEVHRFSVEGLVQPEVLTRGHFPTVVPGDGEVVFTSYQATNSWDLYAMDLNTPGEPRSVVSGTNWQYCAKISPDGKLIAYASRETGRDEVYLRRYPQGDQKRQVSIDGGSWPQWNGAGDRLYFMSELNVVEVTVETEPNLRLGALETLFVRERGDDLIGVGWPLHLQVSSDGQRFFMLYQMDEDKGSRPLLVVERWNGQ
jgi:serine/threonine protein kinase